MNQQNEYKPFTTSPKHKSNQEGQAELDYVYIPEKDEE